MDGVSAVDAISAGGGRGGGAVAGACDCVDDECDNAGDLADAVVVGGRG